jgi:hypothetical protein
MGVEQLKIQQRNPALPPATPEPAKPRETQAIPNPGHRILLLPTGRNRSTTFRNE